MLNLSACEEESELAELREELEKYGYVRCADLKGNIDCSEIIAFMAKTAEDIMKKEKN